MVTMNRPVRFRLVIIVTLAASNAAADVQAWSGLEARVPVSNGRYGAPTHARWVTETRFGGARDGLSLVLVRLSPMWELSPNVLLNLNGVQAMAADNAGVMRPESRVEIAANERGLGFEPCWDGDVHVRAGARSYRRVRRRLSRRWLFEAPALVPNLVRDLDQGGDGPRRR